MENEKKYMIVVHYKFTDKIVNMYFKTKKEMEDILEVVVKSGKLENYNNVEILHKLKIKEVE